MTKEQRQFEAGTPKVSKRKPRWRLMLISDYGKIVVIPKHRAMFVSVAFILALLLFSTGASVFLCLETKRENESLAKNLARNENTVKGLEAEKELLAARLVVAGIDPGLLEVKAEELSPEREAAPPDSSEAGKEASPENPEREKKPAGNGKGESKEQSEDGANSPSSEKEGDGNSPSPSEIVGVEDFKADYDESGSELKFRFKLDNLLDEKLSGYILVLLKNPEKKIDAWVAMSDSPVENGDPSDFKSGRFFEITRFKTIKFTSEDVESVDKFVEAEVYIYNQDGNLLLKKNFSLKS